MKRGAFKKLRARRPLAWAALAAPAFAFIVVVLAPLALAGETLAGLPRVLGAAWDEFCYQWEYNWQDVSKGSREGFRALCEAWRLGWANLRKR